MDELRDVPLAPLTTLRLGGPADRLVVARTAEEVVEAARRDDVALVLGGGSNVVLPDAGVRGTVVLVASRGIEEREDGSVVVEAGEPWDALVTHVVARGLQGMEALAGIPGSTGATPVQNVGAYGQEVADTITAVRALDRERDEVVDLAPADCGFAYRDSRFKREAGRWVVLRVTFGLRRDERSAPVRYAELAKALGVELGADAPLAAVREAVLGLRRGKGMVVDPADPDSRSAGSFFTNPVVAPDAVPDGAPSWPQPDGRVKTSAAWLIQHAGFDRGHARGPAALSSKHTLALTARPGATAADLLGLAGEVRAGVRERFGIDLEPEPRVVG